MNKICTICSIDKDLSLFNNKTTSKDGKMSCCRECESTKKKNYYINNKNAVLAKNKKYRIDNPDVVSERHKKYYGKNKETILKKNNVRTKKWQLENRERVNEYQKTYQKKRRNNDFVYKLKCYLRNAINHSLTRRGYTKKSNTHKILGCSYVEFKIYIESKFESWMSWDNYGLYEKDKYNIGWDIDHIIPVSSSMSEDEVIKLNHYTNLQPLCSKVNRDIKRDYFI
jgi:hypothetical protein